MHIEAGHVDSTWPEFTFVFTYISCLNRLALSAISLKTNSLSYLILFIISLVSIYKREKALNQLLTYLFYVFWWLLVVFFSGII